MRKLLVILGLLGLVGCSSQAHLVRQQWYEIRSDHFRVLTDSSTPEDVEVLVRDLERFRTATIHLLNYSLPDEEVLTVFALKNRASYKGIAGAEMSRKTLGLFLDNLYGRYALINLSGLKNSPYFRDNNWSLQFLFHEYTHYLMARGASFNYPYWYREGFAEFLSTAECNEKGVCLYGKIPPVRAYTLNYRRLLDVEDLLRATPASTPEWKVPQIYASGWLLTHMWSTNRDSVKQQSEYLSAVSKGEDPIAAMAEIFQMSVDELDDQYREYSRGRLAGLSITHEGEFKDIQTYVHQVDSASALQELGKALALNGDEGALEALRLYAEQDGIDAEALKYSIAFSKIKTAETAMMRGAREIDSQTASSLTVSALFGKEFREREFSDHWPRLVYAESLRWEVRQNPELREEKLTKAYNLYKNIVKQDDNVAAAWYGLGVAASQLMVPASVYQKYLWKAYILSPQSEQAALAYLYSLYKAEMWSDYVRVGQRILPIISSQKMRTQLESMIEKIRQQLNATAEASATTDA